MSLSHTANRALHQQLSSYTLVMRQQLTERQKDIACLLRAASYGDLHTVSYLIQRTTVPMTAASGGGYTALDAASMAGQGAVLQMLLQHSYYMQPLIGKAVQCAVAAGQQSAVQVLLAAADPAVKAAALQTMWCTLRAAQDRGSVDVVVQLLSAAGSELVRAADSTGLRGLSAGQVMQWAVRRGHVCVLGPLLASHPRMIDGYGLRFKRKPLHHAVAVRQLEMAQALLAAGAAVDAVNDQQWTPLHDAAFAGDAQMVQLLLAAGASVKAVTSSDSIAAARRKHPDLVCSTALHIAAAAGHTAVTQALLAAGASAEATDFFDYTPLHCAASKGHLSVVQLLLAAGAAINAATPMEQTPLHLAAAGGYAGVVQLLLQAGAACSYHENYGALHYAASAGSEEVVQLLLDRGASYRHAAADGSALELAAGAGHAGVVTLLLEACGDGISAETLASKAWLAAAGGHDAAFAVLARQLHKRSPAALVDLFESDDWGTDLDPVDALVAVLESWSADVSSLEQQRAAHREEVARDRQQLAAERQGLQHLVVQAAGMLKQLDRQRSVHNTVG